MALYWNIEKGLQKENKNFTNIFLIRNTDTLIFLE